MVAGSKRQSFRQAGWIAPVLLFVVLIAVAAGLALWKITGIKKAAAAAASQPEPMESVAAAVAKPREYRRHTTAIGTVVALRSITLQNELPGTVREVMLKPGEIVEPDTVLVALDVSVEQAELKAMEAQAALAETQLSRIQKALQTRATSEMELDRARSERDVAQAQIARAKAIIERKRFALHSKLGWGWPTFIPDSTSRLDRFSRRCKASMKRSMSISTFPSMSGRILNPAIRLKSAPERVVSRSPPKSLPWTLAWTRTLATWPFVRGLPRRNLFRRLVHPSGFKFLPAPSSPLFRCPSALCGRVLPVTMCSSSSRAKMENREPIHGW